MLKSDLKRLIAVSAILLAPASAAFAEAQATPAEEVIHSLTNCVGKMEASRLYFSYVEGLPSAYQAATAVLRNFMSDFQVKNQEVQFEKVKLAAREFEPKLVEAPRETRAMLRRTVAECALVTGVATDISKNRRERAEAVAAYEKAEQKAKLEAQRRAQEHSNEIERLKIAAENEIRVKEAESKRYQLEIESLRAKKATMDAQAILKQEENKLKHAELEMLRLSQAQKKSHDLRDASPQAVSVSQNELLKATSSKTNVVSKPANSGGIIASIVGKTFGKDECKNSHTTFFSEEYQMILVNGQEFASFPVRYEEDGNYLKVLSDGMSEILLWNGSSLTPKWLEFEGVKVHIPDDNPKKECIVSSQPSANKLNREPSTTPVDVNGMFYAISMKDFNAVKEFHKRGVSFDAVVNGKTLTEWAGIVGSREIYEYFTSDNQTDDPLDLYASSRDNGAPWVEQSNIPESMLGSFSGACDFGAINIRSDGVYSKWMDEPEKKDSSHGRIYTSGNFVRIDRNNNADRKEWASTIYEPTADGLRIVDQFFDTGAKSPFPSKSPLKRCRAGT